MLPRCLLFPEVKVPADPKHSFGPTTRLLATPLLGRPLPSCGGQSSGIPHLSCCGIVSPSFWDQGHEQSMGSSTVKSVTDQYGAWGKLPNLSELQRPH